MNETSRHNVGSQGRRSAERTNGNGPRSGRHRKGNEAFVMWTETMAQDPRLFFGNLTSSAGYAMLA